MRSCENSYFINFSIDLYSSVALNISCQADCQSWMLTVQLDA